MLFRNIVNDILYFYIMHICMCFKWKAAIAQRHVETTGNSVSILVTKTGIHRNANFNYNGSKWKAAMWQRLFQRLLWKPDSAKLRPEDAFISYLSALSSVSLDLSPSVIACVPYRRINSHFHSLMVITNTLTWVTNQDTCSNETFIAIVWNL